MNDHDHRGSVNRSVAVVIPAYEVSGHILDLLSRFDGFVSWIFVVDDSCPERTGEARKS